MTIFFAKHDKNTKVLKISVGRHVVSPLLTRVCKCGSLLIITPFAVERKAGEKY